MFRDNNLVYLVASVAITLFGTLLTVIYEVWFGKETTVFATALAIIKWQGVIVPLAVHIVATSEVMRVIGNRMLEKWRENDRERWLQEGRQEAIEADRFRRPGETLEQAIERLRKERNGK